MSIDRSDVPLSMLARCADAPAAASIARRDERSRRIGRLAARSLWQELALHPKPGLVSLHDPGAHRDMDATTFMRSLFVLRPWFVELAAAGARGARFTDLRALGVHAEAAMLAATGGINTHRGAIFTLGLLAAGAGALAARGLPLGDTALRTIIAAQWGTALACEWRPAYAASHGAHVERRYGVHGARGEAVHGFPAVFEVALPALRAALRCGASSTRAQLAAFFALLARVDDTNVLYRSGRRGLAFVQRAARDYIADGDALSANGLARAADLHRAFVARRISPGGCADLLAAALFVHALEDIMA
jgi:triphosphoribosyl-dephospho-CoA synthase